MKKIIFIGLLGIVSLCKGADVWMIAKHSSFEEIPKYAKIASLRENQITDLPLKIDLPNIEELDLRGNQISSIKPEELEGLPKLKKLYLSFNPISDEVIKDLEAHYPDLKIEAKFIGAKYRDQDIAPYRTKGARSRSVQP